MLKLLTDFTENVNTGLNLDLVPILIVGGVLVAVIIFGLIMSQVSKNKKKKRKAQKKNGSDSNSSN